MENAEAVPAHLRTCAHCGESGGTVVAGRHPECRAERDRRLYGGLCVFCNESRGDMRLPWCRRCDAERDPPYRGYLAE